MKDANNLLVFSALALLGWAAYRASAQAGWNDPWSQLATDDGAGDWKPGQEPTFLEELAENFGMLKISEMKNVNPSLLSHPNVQAFLRVIRSKESSQDANAYRMIVGGGQFDSFADHPRIRAVCWTTGSGKRLCSTAAGAYQITATTFDEAKQIMGVPDFSPQSQDLIALGRIAARGALDDVLVGRVDDAVRKLPLEWEAFKRWPDPVYYRSVFAQYGGQLTTSRLT